MTARSGFRTGFSFCVHFLKDTGETFKSISLDTGETFINPFVEIVSRPHSAAARGFSCVLEMAPGMGYMAKRFPEEYGRGRSRANSAPIRQSGPESGLVFHEKVLKNI